MLAMPPRLAIDPVLVIAAKHLIVKYRQQERRTLAAGGDVAAAKIGDDADARHLGKHVGITDLCQVNRVWAGRDDGARSVHGCRWP